MIKQIYTPSEVAELLGLHVKTVRHYVRDGRLKSVKTGKQYRITRKDLEVFAGEPLTAVTESQVGVATEVSCIVSVEGINTKSAERMATFIRAAVKDRNERQALKIETLYDAVRGRLKIIIIGSLETAQEFLRMIEHLAQRSAASANRTAKTAK
ncbi:MAG: helix-turn-helix domain-containing protein [Pseudomonadota bacterium]